MACLPALESVDAALYGSRNPDDLGCLLDMLAWCPHLSAVALELLDCAGAGNAPKPFPSAPAFAKLRSLTKLVLYFRKDPCTLADVVGALATTTGLKELAVTLPQPAVVPAALGQLTSLQALHLQNLSPCELEAGCLDLPKLLRLEFTGCESQNFIVVRHGCRTAPSNDSHSSTSHIEMSSSRSAGKADRSPSARTSRGRFSRSCSGSVWDVSRPTLSITSLDRAVMPVGSSANSFPLTFRTFSPTSCVRAIGKWESPCPLTFTCSSAELNGTKAASPRLAMPGHG